MVTTPIYYVNDKPHIGHVYTSTVADIYARYKRLQNMDVFFLTGTDEHGLKVEQSAEKRQIPAQALADENSLVFQEVMKSNEISFDDFTKLDIRVGTITAAEKVKKADKLLKLTVDTGIDTRTVVSGIAENYNAEDVVGQKVSILLNLAPRKIRGVESQGMILMAENEEGDLAFVSPTKDIETGNTIR